jgi:hypothetical protein
MSRVPHLPIPLNPPLPPIVPPPCARLAIPASSRLLACLVRGNAAAVAQRHAELFDHAGERQRFLSPCGVVCLQAVAHGRVTPACGDSLSKAVTAPTWRQYAQPVAALHAHTHDNSASTCKSPQAAMAVWPNNSWRARLEAIKPEAIDGIALPPQTRAG